MLASASFIKALLADDLAIALFPAVLGEGPRLFDGDLPDGQWSLVSQAAGKTARSRRSTTASADPKSARPDFGPV